MPADHCHNVVRSDTPAWDAHWAEFRRLQAENKLLRAQLSWHHTDDRAYCDGPPDCKDCEALGWTR